MRRVLVVDDSLDAAESFACLLESLGHTAAFVINPLDTVDAAEGIRPEVVFIDIDMPKMDGWKVARALRAAFGTSDLRLVAITGLDGPEDRSRSRRAGFDVHLVKPVSAQEIQTAMEPTWADVL